VQFSFFVVENMNLVTVLARDGPVIILRSVMCTLCTQKHTVKRKLYRIVCSSDRRCILWEAKLIPGASVRAAELFSSVSEIM
jgi:hypothetical protein